MSKWVALLDHPCTCKAASQSGKGQNGSKALSPGCHSSPPWPGWEFVSAACGIKQLVAPWSWGNLCYSWDDLPFYSKRICTVHPLKLVKSNEKSCLSKANFSLALTGACLH